MASNYTCSCILSVSNCKIKRNNGLKLLLVVQVRGWVRHAKSFMRLFKVTLARALSAKFAAVTLIAWKLQWFRIEKFCHLIDKTAAVSFVKWKCLKQWIGIIGPFALAWVSWLENVAYPTRAWSSVQWQDWSEMDTRHNWLDKSMPRGRTERLKPLRLLLWRKTRR